jgi:hypothetical protein
MPNDCPMDHADACGPNKLQITELDDEDQDQHADASPLATPQGLSVNPPHFHSTSDLHPRKRKQRQLVMVDSDILGIVCTSNKVTLVTK